MPTATTDPVSVYFKINNAAGTIDLKVWHSSTGDTSGTPNKSETLSGTLPGGTTDLRLYLLIQNTTAADKTLRRNKIDLISKL
jgi:hypothetical protein